MRKFLLSLPVRLQVLLVVGVTVLLAFVISIGFSLFFDINKLASNTELISSIYQVMGTIYAILLTFTLWGVWQKFSEADLSVQHEAYALLNLVHLIESSQEWKKLPIRKSVQDYISAVMSHLWPKDNSAVALEETNMLTYEVTLNIIRQIQNLNPSNQRELVILNQAFNLMDAWIDARRTRVLLTQGNSAKALWPLLITGALVLFSFHGMFVARTFEIWASLLFGFSFVIGLTFYLVFTLDAPFNGYPRIERQPFDLAVDMLNKTI